MTDPTVPVSDIATSASSAAASALIQNADRLGLKWDLKPATVSQVEPVVTVVYDGDTTPITAVSMIGNVSIDQRVYVIFVPPSGNFIIGRLSDTGQQFLARQTLSTSQASVAFTVPANLRELEVSWSAEGDFAAATVQVRIRLNSVTSSNYLTEQTNGNAGVTTSSLIDGPNSSAFIGQMGASGSATVKGVGKVWFPGWDLAIHRLPVWTFNNGAILSGGFQITGSGIFTILAPLTVISFIPSSGNFIAGSDFQLKGLFT